jgi:type III secretion system needle length determinant
MERPELIQERAASFSRSEAPGPSRPADGAASEKFSRLVDKGGNRPAGAAEQKKPGEGGPPGGNPFDGGLAGLLGQMADGILKTVAPAPEFSAPVNTAAASESATIASQCGELVESIIASQPAADGSAEVRIRLDRAWLPDTEIRLIRTPDAGLEVEFATDSPEAQRFLQPNLSELRGRLSERMEGRIAVRMSESSSGADSDGRSRNRRNLYEEIKES